MNKKLLATIGIIGILAATMFAGCTPQAEKGLQGERGKQGEQGIQGTQGGQGIMGIQGIQGEHGLRGYDGKDGRDGKDGSDGDDGRDGVRGYTGATGTTGSPGEQGEQGIPGADGVDGINGTDCEFLAFLLLAEKTGDPSWDIVEGGAFGYLLYNPIGEKFEYEFEAWGLDAAEDYSLIYYADPWPGDNPGCLIAEFESDSEGEISESGEKDLGMSLPNGSDDNIDHNSDYAEGSDWYAHTNGAKIWLVLSEDLVDGYFPEDASTWDPDEYLFETDLITYIDTDCGFHSDGS